MKPITPEELKSLEACHDDADWSKACDAIKQARQGLYPDDWWAKVKQSGMMDRIMQRWEGSSELQVLDLTVEPSPEPYEPNPYDGTYSEM